MIQTNWTTFQGRPASLFSVDQQHLSNIYWYMLIVLEVPSSELFQVQEQLDDRFNGQLLPYRPHPSFTYEIQILREQGLLVVKEDSGLSQDAYDIVYRGAIVGEIITTPGHAIRVSDDI